jgi:hypothetical protein
MKNLCDSPMARVKKYLVERSKVRGLDRESIHALNTGDDYRAAELTVSDLYALLNLLKPTGISRDYQQQYNTSDI